MAAADSNVAAMNGNDDMFNNFPVGYRFNPRDEELVVHYLMNKVFDRQLPPNKIVDTDVYKHNPQELFAMQPGYGGDERYFFTPRDRKYPNGYLPSRSAGEGYWRASGKGKPVYSEGRKKVGVKTSLKFHIKTSKGDIKTNWMMKEYNLEFAKTSNKKGSNKKGEADDMKLDKWVLCTIYKKKEKKKDDAVEEANNDVMNVLPIARQHPLQIRDHDEENHFMDQLLPLDELPLRIGGIDEDQFIDNFLIEEEGLLPPCYNMPDFSNNFWDLSVDHIEQYCSTSEQVPGVLHLC
ncbi:hypothetical protein ACHQM5_014390 [Ranunculus cassubicifolius]